jgi:hypothetical protein
MEKGFTAWTHGRLGVSASIQSDGALAPNLYIYLSPSVHELSQVALDSWRTYPNGWVRGTPKGVPFRGNSGGSMAFGQISAESIGDPMWTSRRLTPSASVSSVACREGRGLFLASVSWASRHGKSKLAPIFRRGGPRGFGFGSFRRDGVSRSAVGCKFFMLSCRVSWGP